MPLDDPIRIALDLADPALRERLAEAFGRVCGVELVDGDGAADLVLSQPGPRLGSPDLTAREAEVLLILAEGASNREIAGRLGISVHTAKFHVHQILEKLDATGRLDAVTQAARLGVIRL